MKTIVMIQARMNSSRLPGKVLLDLGGKPMLERVIDRASRARRVDQVCVATTTDPSDDQIAAFCASRSIACYRGSQFDVLDRFYQAARQVGAEIIVRLTADCPVIDPALIDQSISAYLENDVDFVATRLPPPWKRTYPIGQDIEVCHFTGLERAWREAKQPYEREHVMPYFYDEDGRFRILVLNHDPDYGSLRWTVDTAEDLEVLRRVFEHFGNRDDFTWLDVLALFQHEPELAQINASVQHKSGLDVDERMKPA